MPTLALFVIYLTIAWKFIVLWWGDHGLWLNEVSRVAEGQVPYRDFAWGYPPLSVYVYAWAVRLFGDSVTVQLVLTALICLSIFVTYCAIVDELFERPLAGVVAVASLLLAVAYSSINSETLINGMYIPATPLGALLMLLFVWMELRHRSSGAIGPALLTGALAGLAVLTKQDFWPAATIAVCHAAWRLFTLRRSTTLAVGPGAVAVGVVTLGTTWVIAQAGWPDFLAGFTGYNVGPEELGRMLPSWERLCTQLILLTLTPLSVLAGLKLARVEVPRFKAVFAALLLLAAAAIAAYVYFAIRHVRPVFDGVVLADPTAWAFGGASDDWGSLRERAFAYLARRLRLNGVSIFLAPMAAAWLLWHWRRLSTESQRGTLLLLLCLCIGGRCRRLFEHTEWHAILFEVPTALLFVKVAMGASSARLMAGLKLIAWGAFSIGAISFLDWTAAPSLGWPGINRPDWGRPTTVITARGSIRMPEADAAAFGELAALVERADPGGRAPVFSVGIQGPLAYYTGRPSPSPLTYGFNFSNRDPEAVLDGLVRLSEKAIVVEEHTYRRPHFTFPAPRVDWRSWELTYQENWVSRIDRAFYDRLLAQYEQVGSAQGRLRSWTVYRWIGESGLRQSPATAVSGR